MTQPLSALTPADSQPPTPNADGHQSADDASPVVSVPPSRLPSRPPSPGGASLLFFWACSPGHGPPRMSIRKRRRACADDFRSLFHDLPARRLLAVACLDLCFLGGSFCVRVTRQPPGSPSIFLLPLALNPSSRLAFLHLALNSRRILFCRVRLPVFALGGRLFVGRTRRAGSRERGSGSVEVLNVMKLTLVLLSHPFPHPTLAHLRRFDSRLLDFPHVER